jgi:hypothetical protein
MIDFATRVQTQYLSAFVLLAAGGDSRERGGGQGRKEPLDVLSSGGDVGYLGDMGGGTSLLASNFKNI